MPRKKTTPPEDRLEELIAQYYALDAQMKELTAKKDPLNKAIKAAMRKRGLTEFRAGELVASYSLQSRIRYFDDLAVPKLKRRGLKQAIKEVVDAETIKELIKAGLLAEDALSECCETKETEILSVKKSNL